MHCHQLTLESYKKYFRSLRSVHGMNVEIHVLFEKLPATVLLNFTRCHLKTIDNCHVITIHINSLALGLILNVASN